MNARLHRIFMLAGPAIVANIATPLLSISDMAISGRMGSAGFIAAVSLGGVLFNLIYWLLGFLRMGTSGLTAQYFGRGDSHGASVILVRSLLIAIGLGLILIFFSGLMLPTLISLMGARQVVRDLVLDYYKVCIWGAPAVLAISSYTGWYIGLQNSRLPMLVSLVMVAVNVALSWTLVFVFGRGIDGLAVGTVVAQYIGFGLFILGSQKSLFIRNLTLSIVVRWHDMRYFFRINTDIFLRTLCMVAVTFWFTRVGAAQGAVVLAANSLLMQLFTLFSYFMDGFAYAAEALCGRCFGAFDHIGLRAFVKLLYVVAGVLALAFAMIYFVMGDVILSVLSDEVDVMDKAHEYIAWAATIPLSGFMAFIADGIAVGLTETRQMLWSLVLSAVVFFIVYATTYHHIGNHALWLAFVAYLAVRGLWLSIVLNRRINRV